MKRATGYKGKCDKLVFEILKAQYDGCQRCGNDRFLQPSHIVSRSYSPTRTDLRNVQLLDARCHLRFSKWPVEFAHWITESIGTERYDELATRAESGEKINWEQEHLRLQEVLSGVQAEEV